MGATLILTLLIMGIGAAQPVAPPIPELPQAYIDTEYHRPEGSTIHVRSGEDLQAAFDQAEPGNTIALQAGATFTGNFVLRPKKGDGWIYVESAALGEKLSHGRRASPDDASYMSKIQTANSQPAISVLPGASHYRLVGIEILPAKGAPRVYQLVSVDFLTSRMEAEIHNLAQRVVPGLVPPDQFPKNIVIDRCYIHGSDTQDVREGVVLNGISVAIVDSHVSDIHDSTMDSQAVLAYRTPGPIKIVNNFLSATTEDVLFGGAGGTTNPYVPSDIEIRNNHFFKPLAWNAPGITLPPQNKWVAKNNLEFKSARRVIVTGNILENNWKSGQEGFSVLLTPRTGQSGNVAVVDDITIENNVLKNVISGFQTLERDDGCGPKYGYPDCTNPGEERRLKIDNNLVLFMNPNGRGGTRNWGLALNVDLTDVVFQHNTLIPFPGTNCDQSVYFESDQSWRWPPPHSYTHNVWILDNVLCRPPTGDWGELGTAALNNYMGDPPPLDKRFLGNVMYAPSGGAMHPFPSKNTLTTKIAFADAASENYQLVSPKWLQTSDGALAGVDMASLVAATAGAASPSAENKSSSQSPAGVGVR
jgi:hypothetical protein